jgi:DNA repair photolyase
MLCNGWTFSLGSACHFKCLFCYVESIVRKHPQVKALMESLSMQGLEFEDVCIVRHDAIPIMREQLLRRRAPDMDTPGVVFTSPLVDCAATAKFALQTAEADRLLLELTAKDIRHLSKGANFGTMIEALPEKYHQRLIFGYSTGTIDDGLAAAFEVRTASPARRLAELHSLQDRGFRTFGMICPVLPRREYRLYAEAVARALRIDKLEHVWVEALNVRGRSKTRTHEGLITAGYHDEAAFLDEVFRDRHSWEAYSRELFEAFATVIPPEKYRFLQYALPDTREWWKARTQMGAIVLGKAVENSGE